MNGEEKHFLKSEFVELKTQFQERWKSHEKRSDDFRTFLKITFDNINDKIESLCKISTDTSTRVSKLPCDLHRQTYQTINKELKTIKTNDLRHINAKINALLFTVLGSVFIAILVFALKALIFISGGN